MPGGGGRCESHYRAEAGLPPLRSNSGKEIHSLPVVKVGAEARAAAVENKEQPGGEQPVKKEDDGRATKLDVPAMQVDRDAGMNTRQLAEKYKCSQATVFAHTKKRVATHRPTLTERAANAPSVDALHGKRGCPRKSAAMDVPAMLENLRTRRDLLADEIESLDRAIKALEEIR